MSFRERSLAWRMAALILGGAGLVLFAVMAVSHFAQRSLLVEEQQARSDALTLAAVNNMETQLGRTEAAVQGAGAAFGLLPGDRAARVALIERTLQTQTHPVRHGRGPASRENPSAGYRILYGSRQGGVVRVADRANPAADYLDDWFYLPYYLRQPVWSEPYYDQDAQTLMVTYSVPVMHKGRVVAVLTGDLTLAWIRQLLDGLPLGKGGTAVLLSAEGVFISHSERRVEMRETVYSLAEALATPEDTAALQELGWSMLSGQPGHRFYRRPLGGQRAYINHRPVAETGWALGVIIPEDQMLAALTRQTRINLLVGAGGLALLLIAALGVAFSVARPLKRLAFAADRLATGDFATPLDGTPRRDEVGRLTESFERMRKDLRRYIDELTTTTASKEKIASELAIAHQIQLGIVPKLFPPFPNRRDLDLFAVLEPARDVGGDLYDFALLDDDHLYVAIGDVSGKGVPASLLMAVGKTLLKSTVQGVRDPARALTLVNTELAEDNDSCMFITAFCGIINLRTGDLTFASAGHNPPLIVRGDKPSRSCAAGRAGPRGIAGQPLPERGRAPRSRRHAAALHRRRHRGHESGERTLRRGAAGRTHARRAAGRHPSVHRIHRARRACPRRGRRAIRRHHAARRESAQFPRRRRAARRRRAGPGRPPDPGQPQGGAAAARRLDRRARRDVRAPARPRREPQPRTGGVGREHRLLRLSRHRRALHRTAPVARGRQPAHRDRGRRTAVRPHRPGRTRHHRPARTAPHRRAGHPFHPQDHGRHVLSPPRRPQCADPA